MYNKVMKISKTKKKTKATEEFKKTTVVVGVLALMVWAIVHLLFAQGCFGIGIWIQGIMALIAAGALMIAAYRLAKSKPFAELLLIGTLPLLLLHIYFTITMNDESLIYVTASAVAPLVGAMLLKGSAWKGIGKRVLYSSLIIIATALTWLASDILRA